MVTTSMFEHSFLHMRAERKKMHSAEMLAQKRTAVNHAGPCSRSTRRATQGCVVVSGGGMQRDQTQTTSTCVAL